MNKKIINIIAAVFFICTFILIGSTQAIASDDSSLQKRIDRLEKDLNALKTLLNDQQAERKAEKEKMADLEKKVTKSGFALTKKGFQIKPYGKIKLDMVHNDSRVSPRSREFAFWAMPETGSSNADKEFNFTGRETRLGFVLTGPTYNGVGIKGLVEIDFYGADGDERKAEPLLRQALMELKFPAFTLLAGQAWDVISPLLPSVCNYTVGWEMGNIGYRRPQLRISKDFSLGEDSKISTRVALSLTGNQDLGIIDVEDGKDRNFPTVQARIGYNTPMNGKKLDIGVSGHYGEEEMDVDYIGDDERYKSWSINADLTIPICPKLSFKGEAFIGENLDTYLGGIGQGVNTTTWEEVGCAGGWGQFTYVASKKIKFNLGAGVDDPDNSDLNIGARERNGFYYGNIFYKIIPPVTLGLEYMRIETDYKNSNDGDANRIQASLIYFF